MSAWIAPRKMSTLERVCLALLLNLCCLIYIHIIDGMCGYPQLGCWDWGGHWHHWSVGQINFSTWRKAKKQHRKQWRVMLSGWGEGGSHTGFRSPWIRMVIGTKSHCMWPHALKCLMFRWVCANLRLDMYTLRCNAHCKMLLLRVKTIVRVMQFWTSLSEERKRKLILLFAHDI